MLTPMSAAALREQEHPYGWVIVGVATVCLTLALGANIIVSVFMKLFEDEFGWLRTETSLAFTMNAIAAAAGGILRGGLSDVIGPKRIGLFDAFALSLGMIALRWQSSGTTGSGSPCRRA